MPEVEQLPLAAVNAAFELLCARRLPKLSYAQQKYCAQVGEGSAGVLAVGTAAAVFTAVVSRFS